MSTARQFMFCVRTKDKKESQIFQQINRASKIISEHGFDVRRINKEDIPSRVCAFIAAAMRGICFRFMRRSTRKSCSAMREEDN